MNNPIINPDTLTQEQREEIRKEIVDIMELPDCTPNDLKLLCLGQDLAILKIFGKSMFDKK